MEAGGAPGSATTVLLCVSKTVAIEATPELSLGPRLRPYPRGWPSPWASHRPLAPGSDGTPRVHCGSTFGPRPARAGRHLGSAVDSEVEGQPPTGSTAARRRVPVRLRRVLQQPFRSVLHQQGLVNSRLTAATEALAKSDRRLALEVGRDIGDLAGRLLGELSELQLTVHRLESALERSTAPITSGWTYGNSAS